MSRPAQRRNTVKIACVVDAEDDRSASGVGKRAERLCQCSLKALGVREQRSALSVEKILLSDRQRLNVRLSPTFTHWTPVERVLTSKCDHGRGCQSQSSSGWR